MSEDERSTPASGTWRAGRTKRVRATLIATAASAAIVLPLIVPWIEASWQVFVVTWTVVGLAACWAVVVWGTARTRNPWILPGIAITLLGYFYGWALANDDPVGRGMSVFGGPILTLFVLGIVASAIRQEDSPPSSKSGD